MVFDLEVTDSQDELEGFLDKATSPVVIWGHTCVGKSAIVSRIIKRLGRVEHKLECNASQLLGNGKANLPLDHSVAEKNAESKATSFVWEWANRETDVSKIQRFYESVTPHLNGSNRNLIMLAHPPTEEISYKLLGPILQLVCDETYHGRLPKYISTALPENIMNESKHVAIFPCVETWFDHTDCRRDGVVMGFIRCLFDENRTDAYKAMHSSLFGSDYDNTMNNLSSRSWETLQGFIDSYGDMFFQGRIEDFDRNKVANAQNWILQDYLFNDGNVRGLEQVVAGLESAKDFQLIKNLEMERLLSLQEFILSGLGEFRERFELYEKKFYQVT